MDTIHSTEEFREVAHLVNLCLYLSILVAQPSHVMWLYNLAALWVLQEARTVERRKQEEHIRQIEVCLDKYYYLRIDS